VRRLSSIAAKWLQRLLDRRSRAADPWHPPDLGS
jgi:hypothetical protein